MTDNINDVARQLGADVSDLCTCDDVRSHLYALIDQELDQDARERLEAHKDECPHCTALTEAELHLRVIIRRSCCEEAPGTLRERVITQVTRRYRTSN